MAIVMEASLDPSSLDSSSSTCKKEMSLKSDRESFETGIRPRVHRPLVKIHTSKSSKRRLSAVLFSVARKVLDRFEPPNVKVNQIRFQPGFSSAVRIALDAGWLGKLRMNKALASEYIIADGESIDLLGKLLCF